MTKEYLKMAEGFKSGAKWFGDALREETGAADELINSAGHASDSHDELVAEVERLRGVVDELERENENISAILLERTSALGPYI